jgi:hypothetical protein
MWVDIILYKYKHMLALYPNNHQLFALSCHYTGWWKGKQDTRKIETRMKAFSYDDFHVCPCKYLYKHMHKYSFILTFKMAALHVYTTLQLWNG